MEPESKYAYILEHMEKVVHNNQSKLDSYHTSGHTTGTSHSSIGSTGSAGPSWKDIYGYDGLSGIANTNPWNVSPPYRTNGGTYTTTSITSVDQMRYDALQSRIDKLEHMLEQRLCVLRPDPDMLQKWELLQSIYEQYKAAEALLYGLDADE